MNWNNWTAATRQHYGYQSLSELQVTWLDWVRQGSPPLNPQSPMIAQQNQGQQTRRRRNAVRLDRRFRARANPRQRGGREP